MKHGIVSYAFMFYIHFMFKNSRTVTIYQIYLLTPKQTIRTSVSYKQTGVTLEPFHVPKYHSIKVGSTIISSKMSICFKFATWPVVISKGKHWPLRYLNNSYWYVGVRYEIIIWFNITTPIWLGSNWYHISFFLTGLYYMVLICFTKREFFITMVCSS